MTRPATGVRLGMCLLISLLGMPSRGSSQTENLNVTPTFQASTHLVLVDVVITDKAGNAVTGLQPQQFQIKEDGKKQQIAFLNPPNPESKGSVPASLPLGVYSNAPEYRAAGPNPIVIVLDAANTQYQDQVYARRQMLKYLKDQHKPGQHIAVFSLTDRLALLQDFTADPELLTATLEKVAPVDASLPRLTSGLQPADVGIRSPLQYQQLLAGFQRFEKSNARYTADSRAEITLDAMRRLARMLGGLPGRKNVVWINAGFPFTLNPDVSVSPGAELQESFYGSFTTDIRQDPPGLQTSHRSIYADALRAVAAQMAAWQVAIYPVDARGLFTRGPFNSADSQETMREVAYETGGKAFVNQNDIDNGVVLAQRDSAATYTIGYYPTNKTMDRKYRSIDIKLDRPGAQITYRRGYFMMDTASAATRKVDQTLSEAWQDGGPDTLVSFEAEVSPVENGKARVDFLVDANTLSVEEAPGGRKFDVGFYVAGISKDGRIMPVQGTKLERAFPTDTYQRIIREGMRLHLDVNAPSDGDQLLLAVRDNRTGLIGTLRTRIRSKP